MARGRSNQLLIPEARGVLEQMKYEVAMQLGIDLPQDGYYGHMTTRDMGLIGGNITRRLVEIAEGQLGIHI